MDTTAEARPEDLQFLISDSDPTTTRLLETPFTQWDSVESGELAST